MEQRNKNTISDGGSTALYTAYTDYTVYTFQTAVHYKYACIVTLLGEVRTLQEWAD